MVVATTQSLDEGRDDEQEAITRGVWGVWAGCALLAATYPKSLGSIANLYHGLLLEAMSKRIFWGRTSAKKFRTPNEEQIYYTSLRALDKAGGYVATLRAPSPSIAEYNLNEMRPEFIWVHRLVDTIIRIDHFDKNLASMEKARAIVAKMRYSDEKKHLSAKSLAKLWAGWRGCAALSYSMISLGVSSAKYLDFDYFYHDKDSRIIDACALASITRSRLIALRPFGWSKKKPVIPEKILLDPLTSPLGMPTYAKIRLKNLVDMTPKDDRKLIDEEIKELNLLVKKS